MSTWKGFPSTGVDRTVESNLAVPTRTHTCSTYRTGMPRFTLWAHELATQATDHNLSVPGDLACEAALDLVGPAPLRSRRPSASPPASWSAGVRLAGTTTVRRSARSARVKGSGGGAPVRPLFRRRRERPGVRRGRRIPSPEPGVSHWVGWPTGQSGPW